MSPEEDLEALLKASVAEAAKRRSDRAKPVVASAVSERYRMAFTDPKNWTITGQVQLVHRDKNIETLLGLFDEHIHLHSKGTRKLVATQSATDVTPRIEYVTGAHWLADRLERKTSTPENTVEIVEDLLLDMGVSAPAVIVKVHILSGGISRVCLMATTTFQGIAPRTFLTVAQGVDILEALTKQTKASIWSQIQEEG